MLLGLFMFIGGNTSKIYYTTLWLFLWRSITNCSPTPVSVLYYLQDYALANLALFKLQQQYLIACNPNLTLPLFKFNKINLNLTMKLNCAICMHLTTASRNSWIVTMMTKFSKWSIFGITVGWNCTNVVLFVGISLWLYILSCKISISNQGQETHISIKDFHYS